MKNIRNSYNMCNTTLQTYNAYFIRLFTKIGYLKKKRKKKKEYNLIASIVQYNELSKAKCVLCHYTVRTVYTIHSTVY